MSTFSGFTHNQLSTRTMSPTNRNYLHQFYIPRSEGGTYWHGNHGRASMSLTNSNHMSGKPTLEHTNSSAWPQKSAAHLTGMDITIASCFGLTKISNSSMSVYVARVRYFLYQSLIFALSITLCNCNCRTGNLHSIS